MDNRGQPELNYSLFTKLLFRIAHQWAINIDLEEYIDLLNKIYQRITIKKTISDKNGVKELRPYLLITFPLDEKKIKDNGGKLESQAKLDEWLECRSNESEKSAFVYEYKEDPENMITKKFKKAKGDAN